MLVTETADFVGRSREFFRSRGATQKLSAKVRIRVRNTEPPSVHTLIIAQERYECVKIECSRPRRGTGDQIGTMSQVHGTRVRMRAAR